MAIDLYCGLGGWAEGFLSEGYDVIGFDIERRPYPGQLVLQDVRTIHGSQFRHADVIVGSSPCQEFSYRAMPWKRAKALPPPYLGMELFEAQFRIQREASAAAGREIPMVVENVKGAQPWVGRAKAHFGSFYLWGDVDSIGNRIVRRGDVRFGAPAVQAESRGAQKFNPDGTAFGQGSWFKIADSKNRGSGQKGRSNFHFFEQTGLPSPSFHGAAHEPSVQRYEGIKQHGSGAAWFDNGICKSGSKSRSRKQKSAEIATIPFPLAQHIARVFKPELTFSALPSTVNHTPAGSDKL